MICDICKKDKTKGEVVGGKFQCSDCKANEGAKLGKLITFYALGSIFSRQTPVTIVSAVYKEGQKYFTRQRADNGWPHDVRFHKSSWGAGCREPGYRTPQEAVDELITSRRRNLESKRKDVIRAEEELEKTIADAERQGFTILVEAE
jgi:hypothetical protein